VFNQRRNRNRIRRFLHPTAGNDCDFDGTGSHQAVTHTDAAQGRKAKSAEDGGFS